MHAKPQFEASVPLQGHILCSQAVGRALSFQLPPAPSPAIACELGAILASSLATQKFPEKALLPLSPPKKKKKKALPANRNLQQGTHLCLLAPLPCTLSTKYGGWHLQNISLRRKGNRKVAQLP